MTRPFPQSEEATRDGARLTAAIASPDEPVLFARATVTEIGDDDEGRPTLILAIGGVEFGRVRTTEEGARFFADRLYDDGGIILAFCKARP